MLALPEAPSTSCNQVALLNPDEKTHLATEIEKEIFVKTMGTEGLVELSKERRRVLMDQKIEKAMSSLIKRLPIDRQIDSIMPDTMKKIPIELKS